MIPITVGILQSQSGNSVIRNFFLALAYTTGIATTFSLFGLLAVSTGQLFGSFLTHPLVIVPVVGLLGYLGFSMLGFYEMYTPSFFKKNNKNTQSSSFVSAFLFGAASGTVASPCLSPGLILLLSIVTTLGDKFLGFILLFSFGIGLSIPLLLIGTFSSSLSLLPRAGSWMVEIKKVFGFMLLGMCFYFLKNILSWPLLMWSISLFTIAIALFYLYQAQNIQLSTPRMINNTLGTLLLATSVLLCFKSYQASNPLIDTIMMPLWLTDYYQAQTQAQEEQKKILLDISAPFCTICKAIDNKLFTDHQVCQALSTVVPVKVDCSDTSNKHYASLQKKYAIIGAPTFILIDPTTEKEIKRWGSELYDVNPQDFIADLKQHN
jgi:thioredoxin:protein disulfide reductase